ncbi:unnamed protein product [Rhizophagus irregularis]|uniref:Uncharacterized protein n=1 Tax=Rhizophagus irregularis TaxID=588596 RepID=A0A915ZHA4_9GLOM|nr:unnamed protein product [Rhizophagus irregularis]
MHSKSILCHFTHIPNLGMYWLRSLLFYKTFLLFSFFTTFVLSCSPKVNNGVVFTINQSNTNTRLQLNPSDAKPGNAIYTVDFSNSKPKDYEIFLLTQPKPGLYELRPFKDNHTLVIEMNAVAPFVLNHTTNSDNQLLHLPFPFFFNIKSISSDNQRFSIDCAKCNIKPNSTNWTQYHTSCSIKNKSSNLCMNSTGPNNNLTQSKCGDATKWDLWGSSFVDSSPTASAGPSPTASAGPSPTASAGPSPTASAGSSCSTPTIKTDPNDVQISKGGLVAIILGSIIGSSLITLATSYWFIGDQLWVYRFIQRKRIYPGHALNT